MKIFLYVIAVSFILLLSCTVERRGNHRPEICDMFIFDNKAIFGYKYGGFDIYDISIPDNCFRIGRCSSGCDKIIANDNTVLFIWDGLYSYNISDKSDIKFQNKIEYVPYLCAPVSKMTLNYPYLYVTDGNEWQNNYNGAISIIDISNESNLTLANSYENTNYINICLYGQYAYLADPSGKLTIMNISNPSNFIFVNSFETLDIPRSIFVQDNYAYIANNYSGLQIVNVSNPLNISKISDFNPFDNKNYCEENHIKAYDVSLNNTNAYLLMDEDLIIVDVSIVSSPILVRHYNLGIRRASKLYIENNFLYILDMNGWFIIYDISVPSDIQLINKYKL